MSTDWIIDDADFGRIKDLRMSGDVIKQFIDSVIYNHPNWNILLQHLSDLYVLVARFDSERLSRDGEKVWKEVMSEENYDTLEKNKKLVIAYMLITEKDEHTHYIELLDTVVRHNNLGKYIINKYEGNREHSIDLIPRNVIQTSARYWAKILNIADDRGIVQKEFIDEFIKEARINPEDVSWDCLYDLCGEGDKRNQSLNYRTEIQN